MAGSTTGEPFAPAPLGALMLDIIETHRGAWLSPDDILHHLLRIRPDADTTFLDRTIRQIRINGGGTYPRDPQSHAGEWVGKDGRLHRGEWVGRNGRLFCSVWDDEAQRHRTSFAPMGGRWIAVESKPDPLSDSTDRGFLLRLRP